MYTALNCKCCVPKHQLNSRRKSEKIIHIATRLIIIYYVYIN